MVSSVSDYIDGMFKVMEDTSEVSKMVKGDFVIPS